MTGLGLAVVMAIAGGDGAMAAFSTEVIETTSGPVQGSSDGHVDKFLGIRYAASPAGDNRWLPPVAPERSHAIIDATKPGSPCPQQVNQFSPQPPFSEDCLFLNVWRPHDSDRDEGLPVMIWIHGGALVNGAGAAFDPSVMVETGHIIVVTINYRLGALGWLADAAIADADGNSGNYGLMDQQLAMTWVRKNIRDFGGNPKRVTISGESAGGLSTLSNLASPTAHGLFRGAIVESGAYMIFSIRSLAVQEALGTAFATAVGCTGTNPQIAACLRNGPVASLIAAQGIINTSPTKGVPTLPQGLSDAFSSGEFNQVPVTQGTNLNEGTLFEPFFFDPTFKFVPGGPLNGLIAAHILTYPQAVGGLVGPANAAAVAALYPPTNFPNPDAGGAASADKAWGQIFTDITFTCHGLTANRLLSKFVPVYAYEFADPNAPNLFQPLIGFSYGASHASELQYLFDAKTLQGPADAAANAASPAPGAAVQPPPLTAGGTQLAEEMKAYWTNFVKHRTPNGGDDRDDDLAHWPRFDADGDVQLLVPGPTEPHPFENFGAEHNCQQLEALGLLGG
jgi:para-nitrobenzyl esterase